jgi:hypothetical protein
MILIKALAAGVGLTVACFLALAVVVVPLAANVNALTTTSGISAIEPSSEARDDIPPTLLNLYIHAASACPGLPWTVLAGIAKVESNHGRYHGATIGPDGRVTPEIIGVPLNGRNGTALITDTDNGRLDNDTIYDRAVGPFQFIPTSWSIYGLDGDHDGTADPHNIHDAAPAAVNHLCPTGQLTDIDPAVLAYNHSTAYLTWVLDWAATYTGAVHAIPVAGYAPPVDNITPDQADRPHHDYPAWDIAVPTGSPAYAITSGTITVAIDNAGVYTPGGNRCGNTIVLQGNDQARYTYCHLTALTVTTGDQVQAGQQIATTGGQPGTPGAGNTTGAHLHLGLRINGQSHCPQPLIHSIIQSQPINPHTTPTTGCTN